MSKGCRYASNGYIAINLPSGGSLRAYIPTTSGAWILFLMRCLTGDDCACCRLSTFTPANAWRSASDRSDRDAEQHSAQRPLPQFLKTDNGSEFAGKMLDKWVYERGSRIDFSRPETPTDNATVEFFNDSLRQECLNEKWFMSVEDARCKSRTGAYTITRSVPILHWAG